MFILWKQKMKKYMLKHMDIKNLKFKHAQN